jgi:hypothetical protein
MEPSKQTLPEMSISEGEKVTDLCARLGITLETALALATAGPTDRRVIACELAISRAGGAKALATHLGIKRQAVVNWLMVPPRRCPKVEQITGIPREVLRPDIFGDEAAA